MLIDTTSKTVSLLDRILKRQGVILVPHLLLLLIIKSKECVFISSRNKTTFEINALHWLQKIPFDKYQTKLSRVENMARDLVVRKFQINHR